MHTGLGNWWKDLDFNRKVVEKGNWKRKNQVGGGLKRNISWERWKEKRRQTKADKIFFLIYFDNNKERETERENEIGFKPWEDMRTESDRGQMDKQEAMVMQRSSMMYARRDLQTKTQSCQWFLRWNVDHSSVADVDTVGTVSSGAAQSSGL